MNDDILHPLRAVNDQIRDKRYRLATKRGYLALLKNIAIAAVFIVIVFSQIFLVKVANGTDMYPAVLDGDVLLCYRLDHNYVKDDVVVFTVLDKEIIGRVVAKSGDRVEIEDGVLYVNGTAQTGEIAFPTDAKKLECPYIVPENSIFVLGDHRTSTYDSRDFGAIKTDQVKAKVVSIFRKRGI